MVCTHTLYNEIWAGNLDLSVTELPEAMKRKRYKGSKPHKNKKSYEKRIFERPVPWTMAQSSSVSHRSRTGAVRPTILPPIHPGSALRTSATMSCSGFSYPRGDRLDFSLQSTF